MQHKTNIEILSSVYPGEVRTNGVKASGMPIAANVLPRLNEDSTVNLGK